MAMKHYQFFSNTSCEYYPCHQMDQINCLFCFCPLYTMACGGKFTISENGRKDCSACTLPHSETGYDYVVAKLKDFGKSKK